MNEEIIRFLNRKKERNILVSQLGFIETNFYIFDYTYNIKNDLLSIENKQNVKIIININQIYKIDYLENGIILNMDNDTKIKLEYTKREEM